MNVKRVLLLVAAVLVLTAFAPAAQASQYWPVVQRTYSCFWSLPEVSGQSLVTFTALNGNDYYRWGYMTTVYPNGGRNEVRVVVTKPVLTPSFTEYEYTTNTSIQCAFRVHSYGVLEWFNCSNGANQFCF